MLTWINTILKGVLKFVSLPANKQIIYLLFSIIMVAGSLTIYFYKKNESAHIQIRKELEKSENTILNLSKERDSLYKVIHNIQLQNLIKELDRSDSLLRESERLKNSISPIIKKLNKKIENSNN